MLKVIRILIQYLHRFINCMKPDAGFRNRKIIKSYSGFQKKFYTEFWANATESIGASLSDAGYGFFKIEYKNKKTYVSDYKVMIDDHLTLKVAGNKPMVLKMLRDSGLYTVNFLEYKMSSINSAFDFLKNLKGNAVIKPAKGTGSGKGVTTHINTDEKLKKASLLAASFNENLLIEEQVDGDSYRLLYLDGKFIDGIRRDPPTVIGDGVSNIKTLVNNENIKRIKADEILTFHPLIIDMECKLKLKEQGMTTKSIPKNGKKIIIKSVVNQNSRYENHIIRDDVHPEIIEIGRNIVNELGIVLGGIDIITKDISVPLQDSKGIINEINTTPGLHHHLLVSNKEKVLPIGEMILNYIFNK